MLKVYLHSSQDRVLSMLKHFLTAGRQFATPIQINYLAIIYLNDKIPLVYLKIENMIQYKEFDMTLTYGTLEALFYHSSNFLVSYKCIRL